jgi:hypothetical protein
LKARRRITRMVRTYMKSGGVTLAAAPAAEETGAETQEEQLQ